jgi:serine/threonine-protein kinase HipA
MMRQLRAFIDHLPVGTLFEGDDLWAFEYEESWIRFPEGFDLSPGLPRDRVRIADGGTNRPVQWYFDNLLPEELLRQAISREAGIKGEDAFALLEYLGAESAGSLTLLPPGQAIAESGEFARLSDEALSTRIRKLPRSTLTADAPKRMSLAGAQHKLLAVLVNGHIHEPVGGTPSTHIVKPGHPDVNEYPASVANEYVTMRLAAACGLPVPAVALRYVPEPVYIVERFDRRIEAQGKGPHLEGRRVFRRHVIDACQLLTRSRPCRTSSPRRPTRRRHACSCFAGWCSTLRWPTTTAT